MFKRGRRQSNPVHNHFKYDDITSTSICIHCEKSIPEKYNTNLLAHMKIYHPEITIIVVAPIETWEGLAPKFCFYESVDIFHSELLP